MAKKEFDLVVFGASGYTGQLVAQFIADRPAWNLTWAIAGRNDKKLESLRSSLAGSSTAIKPAIIEADSYDKVSLAAMVQRTKAVISTVGPYDEYGELLVEACVEAGVHYGDLAGEVPFIRRMIDRFDGLAKTNQARIVHCCGFDSVPSDLGTYLLQEEALRQFGQPCGEVKLGVRDAKGGFSGGTVASLGAVFKKAGTDKWTRKLLADPQSLSQSIQMNGNSKRSGDQGSTVQPVEDLDTSKYDKNFGWVTPFVMAPINTRVVRRSAALLPDHYGSDFKYTEAKIVGENFPARYLAALSAMMQRGFTNAMMRPRVSGLLMRWLPKAGSGPSAKVRRNGYFKMELLGFKKFDTEELDTGEADTEEPKLKLKIEGSGDPGYAATSRLLAICGKLLAHGKVRDPEQYGVITPAVAFGAGLAGELRDEGFVFDFQKV